MRWFVAAVLIALVPPASADVRDDAKTYLAREWRCRPDHCLIALQLVVENDRRMEALQELEKDLPALYRTCDHMSAGDVVRHIKAVYEQAYKFNDPTGKTDDLWEMVAKSSLEPAQPCPPPNATPPPKNDSETASALACLNSYIHIKNTVYPADIPALNKVRQLYGQKLYLAAIYRLLHQVDPSGPNYNFTLANYRACYAIAPDSGKYPLFELVQTVLGK